MEEKGFGPHSARLLSRITIFPESNGKKRAEIPDETLSRVPVRQAEGMMILDPYNTAAGIEPVDSSTAYLEIERLDKR